MVIVRLTGSSSDGQFIALSIFALHYLDMEVNVEALHRTVSISSGTLDSLPHGGYVVTIIRSIAGETHKDASPCIWCNDSNCTDCSSSSCRSLILNLSRNLD